MGNKEAFHVLINAPEQSTLVHPQQSNTLQLCSKKAHKAWTLQPKQNGTTSSGSSQQISHDPSSQWGYQIGTSSRRWI